MWFMSYTMTRDFSTADRPGLKVVKMGMHVSEDHPLITVRRWQTMYDQRRERDALSGRTVIVLTHYARLSEQERMELTAAGIDLTAQDVEADIT